MDRRQLLAMTVPVALAAAEVKAGPPGNSSPTSPPVPAGAAAGKPLLFGDDHQFWYETLRMFGAAEHGGAQFGEVVAISSRIAPGDYDAWHDAWSEAADKIAAEAAGQLARGHGVSARDGYARASNYYRSSEFFLHGNPDDPRIARAYQRSVECYKIAAGLFDRPIEAVEIPYEQTTLPGYFHRASAPGRRPTIIMHSGFDGSAEEMHFIGGARDAVERGYNALVFDGPGQFGPIHRAGLVFRPDWEKVVTPVVDFALKDPGVDPGRIALMGVSLGGELAPRAAAFEKRLAALIANDGVYDFSAPHLATVPPEQHAEFVTLLRAEQAPAIDQMLDGVMKSSPTTRWAFAHGMYATGAPTPRAYLAAVLDYNLRDGIAEAISCPTLVCEAEGDIFFKGQPQLLYDHLTCKKTLMRFTEAEGAGAHCQVGANRLAFARIYDWLDETLG
jgi:dienelactone hydrolase